MKLSHCHILVLVVLCLGFTNLAFGTTYYVSTSGDDVNGTGSPFNPFKTIQHGIDSSTNGDAVIAQQGTYVENIDFLGKAITVRGSDPNNWQTVAATIINGNGSWGAVVFYWGETSSSVLEGITVTNENTAIDCGDDGSPIIRRCIIENSGDGITCSYGNPIIINNIVRNNSNFGIGLGTYAGGEIKNNAIYDNYCGMAPGYVTVTANNTITKNEIGIIYFDSYSSPLVIIKNCIIWGNGDDLNGCNAAYSCFSGGTGNNISSDPCFVNADTNEFHLKSNSPCINAGDPNSTGVGEVDIDGQSRVQGSRIDMGADETTFRVHKIGGGWYDSISSAITDADNNDVIEVFPGIYYENIDYGGKAITVRGSDPNNWEMVAATIINANNTDANVVTFHNGEENYSILTGFTITGGRDGVVCSNSSPIITNCIIQDNSSCGVYCYSGSPVIANNKIFSNAAAGIYANAAAPTIQNNLIYSNSTGVNFEDATSSATVSNNTLVKNTSYGINVISGTAPTIFNCIVWDCNDDMLGCSVTYSCISDGDTGTGNISSYPYFADYNNNDFHLTWNSPCLDKGDPNGSYTGETDIDGEARVYNSRCDIGADELGDGVNLLANPGFEAGGGGWNESGQTSPSIPLYWQDQWSSTSKTIDSSQKHSGNYSWKFYNSVTTKCSGAYSDFVPKNNDFYRLSAWAKSQNGTEPAYLGISEWDQIDYASNNINWSFVQYFLSNAKIPTEWTKYTRIIYPLSITSSYFRAIFFGPYLAAGTVWWDDFELIDLGPNFLYLPPYGVSNEPNITETVEFGDVEQNIDWIVGDSNITDKTTDSNDNNITYRELLADKIIEIQFPAFNADANGFPQTPMLLEIMFKDTTHSPVSGATLSNYVKVSSGLQYVNLDPNYNITDPNFECSLISLGGAGDDKWKYVQYAFQKSEYQRLQAINGKYVFRIRGKDAQVPLDYVSLRKISDEEYWAFVNKQREARGFYKVELPADVPISPPDYNDLTVYVRDMMKPVYKHTKPAASEIISDINAVSAWGLVEPVSLAIYSQNGIDNLTVEVSDLIHSQDANSVIPKEDISVSRVIYSETRLGYYSAADSRVSYALMPDYLKEFTTLSIDPNSSERVWISIKVPQASANLSGGLYEGTITIKQNGNVLKNIQLDLDVLNVTLDKSEHMNTAYHDPTSRVYSATDLSSVLRLYAETGLEPFMGGGNENGRVVRARDPNGNVIHDANGLPEFDTAGLEEALDRMKAAGCLPDKINIFLLEYWQLFAEYGISYTDPDFYNQLSASNFVNALAKLLHTFKQVGDDPNRKVTFVFHVCDEPGNDPYKRILSDRLYNIIRDCNYLSGVTYYTVCDSSLHIDPNRYILPVALDHNLPALTDLIDYKTWILSYEGTGYSNHRDPNYYGEFGYYTTEHSHWRDPAYNRFLHGLFAFGTDATVVAAYAMGDYIGDPYNDFDADISHAFPFTYPDFLYAYPTWSGKLYPTIGGIEGIREGIKDARYIATLKRLISEYPGTDDANYAQAYLNNLKNKIDPNLMSGYYNKRTELGYAQEIFSHISDSNDPNDFEAFTKVRETVIDCIKKLLL